jgi:hypothetical protein
MIHYQDSRTQIELHGRVLIVLPRPLHDIERAAEIHEMFPEREGWTHYRYTVSRIIEQEHKRAEMARAVEERLRAYGDVVEMKRLA